MHLALLSSAVLTCYATACHALSGHGHSGEHVQLLKRDYVTEAADGAPQAHVASAGHEAGGDNQLERRSSNDNRCGPSANNQICAAGQCCSSSGFCGTTVDYCKSPDCLFAFGPGCDANKTPRGESTESISRVKNGNITYGGTGIFPCKKIGTFALTFDDGPGNYTNDLLDMLAKYGAKATFFMTGVNRGKGRIDDESMPWPSIIRRMHAEKHQLASHTWSHANLSSITPEQRKNEVIKLEMALRNIVGFIPTYIRPPYSSCTNASGCPADLAALGYHITYFDFDTQDYKHTTPDLIQQSKDASDALLAKRDPKTGDYLHVAHDIHFQTVHNLTAYLLPKLATQGWKLVTVGECLNDPVANWYRIAPKSSIPPNTTLADAGTSSSLATVNNAAATSASTTAVSPSSTSSAKSGAVRQKGRVVEVLDMIGKLRKKYIRRPANRSAEL